MSVERELLAKFQAKQWTLAFVESCTGGDLAARVTKIPDASKVFLGSIVSYSDQLKKGLLAVNPELLPDKVVSEEVALEMVKGLFSLLDPTVCVAVTGYAGPSGKEVGNVWVAYQKKGEDPRAINLHLTGSREEIIHQIGDIVFAYLKDEIVK